MAGSALEKRLELNFTIDPAVPAVVEGDERHLEEVLRILLDNAVKYTRTGSVECSVQYAHDSGMDDGCRPLFVVADTGPGMDAAPRKSRPGISSGLEVEIRSFQEEWHKQGIYHHANQQYARQQRGWRDGLL